MSEPQCMARPSTPRRKAGSEMRVGGWDGSAVNWLPKASKAAMRWSQTAVTSTTRSGAPGFSPPTQASARGRQGSPGQG